VGGTGRYLSRTEATGSIEEEPGVIIIGAEDPAFEWTRVNHQNGPNLKVTDLRGPVVVREGARRGTPRDSAAHSCEEFTFRCGALWAGTSMLLWLEKHYGVSLWMGG
jgi:hypothetical protein